MSEERKVDLTVDYTGAKPFHEIIHDNPTFHHIKHQALKAFGLEPAAGNKYVLQYEGTDVDEKRHIDSLDKQKVVLLLMLKDEPVKG